MQDMMTLLKTMMGLGSLEHAPMVARATRFSFDSYPNGQIGLFWNRLKGENIVWHNGGTYGSSSFIGYDPDQLVGIVVLSNSQIMDGQGIDWRLDLAAIQTIQQVASLLKMDKPVQVLKEYDAEVYRRIVEFEKSPSEPQIKEWVQRKIAHMHDLDVSIRNLFMNVVDQEFHDQEKVFFQQGYSRRFYMVDWQNTEDLKRLIGLHGWFKVSDWGKKVDHQAWLLVQHADHDPDFQKEVLNRLTHLYKSKETDPANYAYLFDRVASSFKDPSKRRLQRYGTQGQCIGPGQWEPLPIEDAVNVDQRRAEVGLVPLKEYRDGFKDICR
jgi:hypothetical protein